MSGTRVGLSTNWFSRFRSGNDSTISTSHGRSIHKSYPHDIEDMEITIENNFGVRLRKNHLNCICLRELFGEIWHHNSTAVRLMIPKLSKQLLGCQVKVIPFPFPYPKTKKKIPVPTVVCDFVGFQKSPLYSEHRNFL